MDQKPLVLLPAAGFGTRVGSPNAKEIMQGPDGRPLIEKALKQALARHWPVHLITRKEKTSLIQYLNEFKISTGLELHIQLIEPSREWPESILKSKSFWRSRNLLCLPDTDFSPNDIWDRLVASESPISAAVFQPKDFSTWGVLRKTQKGTEICEKPRELKTEMQAWGLLSFTPDAGETLLQAQLESTFHHQWIEIPYQSEFLNLDSFEDLTRY